MDIKEKELSILYGMLKPYRDLSGIDTEKDHLKEGSAFFSTAPRKPDTKPAKKVIRENRYHKGKTIVRTKTFVKKSFVFTMFGVFSIQETTSTNDKYFALTSKIVNLITIIALSIIFAMTLSTLIK